MRRWPYLLAVLAGMAGAVVYLYRETRRMAGSNAEGLSRLLSPSEP